MDLEVFKLLRVPWKCSKSHFVLKLSRKNPQYGHKFWTAWAMQLKFLEFSILNETMKWWIFQGFYFFWLDMDLMSLVGMTLLLSLVMWCELVNFYFRLFFNFSQQQQYANVKFKKIRRCMNISWMQQNFLNEYLKSKGNFCLAFKIDKQTLFDIWTKY